MTGKQTLSIIVTLKKAEVPVTSITFITGIQHGQCDTVTCHLVIF